MEDPIAALSALGFSRERVLNALRARGGNQEEAVEFILDTDQNNNTNAEILIGQLLSVGHSRAQCEAALRFGGADMSVRNLTQWIEAHCAEPPNGRGHVMREVEGEEEGALEVNDAGRGVRLGPLSPTTYVCGFEGCGTEGGGGGQCGSCGRFERQRRERPRPFMCALCRSVCRSSACVHCALCSDCCLAGVTLTCPGLANGGHLHQHAMRLERSGGMPGRTCRVASPGCLRLRVSWRCHDCTFAACAACVATSSRPSFVRSGRAGRLMLAGRFVPGAPGGGARRVGGVEQQQQQHRLASNYCPASIAAVTRLRWEEASNCRYNSSNAQLVVGERRSAPLIQSRQPAAAFAATSSLRHRLERRLSERSLKALDEFGGESRHLGEWRSGGWCSLAFARDGLVCGHSTTQSMLEPPHWSCCGALESDAAGCASPTMSGDSSSQRRSAAEVTVAEHVLALGARLIDDERDPTTDRETVRCAVAAGALGEAAALALSRLLGNSALHHLQRRHVDADEMSMDESPAPPPVLCCAVCAEPLLCDDEEQPCTTAAGCVGCLQGHPLHASCAADLAIGGASCPSCRSDIHHAKVPCAQDLEVMLAELTKSDDDLESSKKKKKKSKKKKKQEEEEEEATRKEEAERETMEAEEAASSLAAAADTTRELGEVSPRIAEMQAGDSVRIRSVPTNAEGSIDQLQRERFGLQEEMTSELGTDGVIIATNEGVDVRNGRTGAVWRWAPEMLVRLRPAAPTGPRLRRGAVADVAAAAAAALAATPDQQQHLVATSRLSRLRSEHVALSSARELAEKREADRIAVKAAATAKKSTRRTRSNTTNSRRKRNRNDEEEEEEEEKEVELFRLGADVRRYRHLSALSEALEDKEAVAKQLAAGELDSAARAIRRHNAATRCDAARWTDAFFDCDLTDEQRKTVLPSVKRLWRVAPWCRLELFVSPQSSAQRTGSCLSPKTTFEVIKEVVDAKGRAWVRVGNVDAWRQGQQVPRLLPPQGWCRTRLDGPGSPKVCGPVGTSLRCFCCGDGLEASVDFSQSAFAELEGDYKRGDECRVASTLAKVVVDQVVQGTGNHEYDDSDDDDGNSDEVLLCHFTTSASTSSDEEETKTKKKQKKKQKQQTEEIPVDCSFAFRRQELLRVVRRREDTEALRMVAGAPRSRRELALQGGSLKEVKAAWEAGAQLQTDPLYASCLRGHCYHASCFQGLLVAGSKCPAPRCGERLALPPPSKKADETNDTCCSTPRQRTQSEAAFEEQEEAAPGTVATAAAGHVLKMCPVCFSGPLMNEHCEDLRAHHGQCPRCQNKIPRAGPSIIDALASVSGVGDSIGAAIPKCPSCDVAVTFNGCTQCGHLLTRTSWDELPVWDPDAKAKCLVEHRQRLAERSASSEVRAEALYLEHSSSKEQESPLIDFNEVPPSQPETRLSGAPMHQPGCPADCNRDHEGGECLNCGEDWGHHMGHHCQAEGFAGQRGSWLLEGSEQGDY